MFFRIQVEEVQPNGQFSHFHLSFLPQTLTHAFFSLSQTYPQWIPRARGENSLKIPRIESHYTSDSQNLTFASTSLARMKRESKVPSLWAEGLNSLFKCTKSAW